MAIRIQLRRDTAANWVSSNPVLRAGEVGIETDTLKFKIGNGSSTWTQITNYANVTSTGLSNSLNDYILASTLGNPSGPAKLNSDGEILVPEDTIILWNDAGYTYTTKVVATQPTANRIITLPNNTGTVALTSDIITSTTGISEGTNKYFTDERAQDAAALALSNGSHTNITVTYNDSANSISLAAAPGYVDEQAVDAVAAALAAGTHTNISVSYNDAGNAISLTGAQTYSDENAQDAVGNALGTGLSYNDTTGAISVDTTTIQARVANVTDTEIGYLDGVTSAIQTQIDTKLTSATAASTYAPIASPTFTGTVAGITKSMVGLGNVDNTTDVNKPVSTATQTALDLKAPIASPTFTGTVTLPGAPTSDLHAATKAYVDASTSGLNVHASVKTATIGDINLNNQVEAGDILDGVTLAHNDRILVKNQNQARDNGVYVVQPSGAPVRADDYNVVGEVDAGDFIFVESGTVNAKTGWIQTNVITTLGTDPIAFTQFSGAGTYSANNGLTLTGNVFSINTGITADLTTAQTLTNKTLTSPTITGTGAIAGVFTGDLTGNVTGNVSGNAGTVTNGVYTTGSYSNPSWITSLGWSKISSTPTTISGYGITDGVSTGGSYSNPSWLTSLGWSKISGTPTTLAGYGITDALASTTAASTYAPLASPTFTGTVVLPSTVNGPSISTSVNLLFPTQSGHITLGGSQTTGNLTLGGGANRTTGVIGIGTGATTTGTKTIDIGTGSTGGTTAITIGSSSGATSNITLNGTTTATNLNLTNALGPIYGGTGLTSYVSGDILYASATNTLAKLAKGSNGQILTLASGLPSWADAPITLPSQTGNNGKYLTTDGTNASWATLSVPITTSTATVSSNTATTIDTTALSTFTSIEYMVSLKQGSKVRTSKVVVQTDGTSVDMTEFAITETGGTMTGVVVSASVSSTNAILQVTVTDAATTNVTVKFSRVAL